MLLLGWAVGKASTPVDDWFLRDNVRIYDYRLVGLFFTDWRLVIGSWLVGVAGALWQRRWQLAAVVTLCPPTTVVLVTVLKRWFGREKDGALAYPSGHTTLAVVVFGMLVLVAGCQTWVVILAATAAMLGTIGQALSYHYFTDAIGGVLLGSALVCVAAELTGCGPRGRAPT
jgi:membrane-associated phospholipid phosphatase